MTVDLTNCASEPIHIIGRIQSFGYLLAVSPQWIIAFASENLSELVGQPAGTLIGCAARTILSEAAIHTLRTRLQMLNSELSVERIFATPLFDRGSGDDGSGEEEQLFDVALHRSGSHIVIEAELSDTSTLARYVNYVRPMTERVKLAGDTRAMCDMAARQMRALTGLDRVMVYRFAGDDSGEVIAESRAIGIDSFMGMHFPGADIPIQARELYTKNLLRLIADVADPTVALISAPGISTAGNAEQAPLDLTMSTLRAVSPIHIEYLGNMGVGASMSASIVRDGKLWGLFACHHYQPLKLSYPVRTAAELFAETFATLLDQSERKHSQQLAQTAVRVRDELLGRLGDGASLISHFDHFAESMAAVIPHDGIAAWIGGAFVSHGEVPERADVVALAQFLGITAAGQVWSSDCLTQDFAPAAAYRQRCAGLLALPVSRKPRDFIMLFRHEVSMNKPWAGNPEKEFTVGPNGPRLTPRQSFALWNETVAGHCREWSADERHCAEAMRATLLEVVARLTETAAVERERAAREGEFLIAELNHRFRNMLGLVRSLISQSQTSAATSDTGVPEFARNIDNRIESLARAHDQLTHTRHAPVSLHRLIATEARAYTQGRDDPAIVVSGEDVLIVPLAVTTLTLVIHELMTNARKYGSLSTRGTASAVVGKLHITTTRDAGSIPAAGLVLHWRETGGPVVTPPMRRGFGSTIFERLIPHELGGSATIEYLPQGVVARIAVPAQHLVDGNAVKMMSDKPFTVPAGSSLADPGLVDEATLRAMQPGRPAVRPRFSALVVEDNMLIAMDAEEALRELGASQVQLCPNVSSALDSIATAGFDVALLDVNLGDETSEAIAIALRARATPFVMTTGLGDYVSDISAYAGAPVLTKPYAPAALSRALAQVLD